MQKNSGLETFNPFLMTQTSPLNNATIEACQAMLRGEISAVETYTQASETFADNTDDDSLGSICGDHQQSVDLLHELILSNGETPDLTSGVWGNFAQAMEGTAKLFGESPALLILEQGEQHGIKEYEAALTDPTMSPGIKELIELDLLPPLYDHVMELKSRRENLH